MEERAEFALSPVQRGELLTRARAAAAKALGNPSKENLLPPSSGPLLSPGMSFVTWKRGGRLRGCIGSVEPVRPLWADVQANAVHALLDDPRFPSATASELADLDLEISVLTPFELLERPPLGIEIGVHGLLVEKGFHRGLLLPQVPVEWEWDVPEFLAHTCGKAGLPGTAWRDPDARVYTFRAEVFGEREAPLRR